MPFLNLPSVRGADEPVSGSSLGRILRRAWAVFEDSDDGHVKLKKPDDTLVDLEAGVGQQGKGPPISTGVNSIHILGFLAAAPAGGDLVLAVDDGENPVEVTLPGAVVDDALAQGEAVFAAQGVTVSFASWSGGEFDGLPAFEFTGDYGDKPITVSVVSNTIVDGSDDPIALDPADPVEVRVGISPTLDNPTTGDHYLDTLTGLTWTYNGSIWVPPVGAVLDYVEVATGVSFTDINDTFVITGNPITFDGNTAIIVEFYSVGVLVDDVGGACIYNLALLDGSDGTAPMFPIANGDFAPGANGSVPIYVRTPTFTPAAGEHVFSVKALAGVGGGGTVVGGTGVGDTPPIYLRVTRA